MGCRNCGISGFQRAFGGWGVGRIGAFSRQISLPPQIATGHFARYVPPPSQVTPTPNRQIACPPGQYNYNGQCQDPATWTAQQMAEYNARQRKMPQRPFEHPYPKLALHGFYNPRSNWQPNWPNFGS